MQQPKQRIFCKERRVYRKRKEEAERIEKREAQQQAALHQLLQERGGAPAKQKHVPDLPPSPPPRLPYLEKLRARNEERRRQQAEEKEEGEKRREEKLRQREKWKKKFQQKTKKGQIPLAHRVNYMFRKIKSTCSTSNAKSVPRL